MTKQMRRAYAYLRVSGPTQVGDDKFGLARQRDKIRKWATANHVKIAGEFIDTMTGTSEWGVRPGWQKMLTAMLADGVTLIVIDELGRLARDVMVQEKIIANLQERKFDLASFTEPDLCSNDPSRKFFRRILGIFAEYEKDMLIAKLAAAKLQAREDNPDFKEGRPSFGDNPDAKLKATEQKTIARVLQLSAAGNNLPAIVRVLNAEGHKTQKGKTFFPNQVARILKRARV